MKWKLIAVAVVFAGLVGLRFADVLSGQGSSPAAVNGVMDLRKWDFAAEPVIDLYGEWDFYPGQFVRPDGAFRERDKAGLQVPGGWDQLLSSPFGNGTYKLTVLLPESGPGQTHKYAIRTSIIRTAHTFYVNGERIGGSGEPGVSRTEARPFVLPYTAGFTVNGSRAELVVHASNYEYASGGGIFQGISFGATDSLARRNVLEIGQNAILMGLFLICGFFFLMLFFFRPRNRELLYFSIFFWMSLLFWLTHNERLLFWLIPDLPYDLGLRLQVLPSAVLFTSMLGFVSRMYPDNSKPWVKRFAAAGMIGFTVIYLFTDVAFFSRTELYLFAFDLILVILCGYILVREVVRGTRDSVQSLIAACCIVYEALFQGLYYLGLEGTHHIPPVEKIVFPLVMSLVIARRFFTGMKEIETLSKKLIVADRLKNDFLATTSGELRLPLHGMINIAHTMINDDGLSERQTERLSLLMATGRRMVHLLGDILDLSKLNGGDLSLQRRTIDVGMLISGVTDVMRYLKDGRPVRFDNRVEPGLPQVSADEHRMMQVLFHLFHFAFKWGAQGAVRVDAQSAADGILVEVAIRAGRIGSASGEPETQPLLSASDFSLEISRKLLGLHGSELKVAETENSLQMSFLLPAGEDETALPAAASSVLPFHPLIEPQEQNGVWRHTAPDSPRVLVVDDDRVSLRVMFDILVQERLDVTAVADGREALKLIEGEGGWDLIVLEAVLPHLSGYDLCRKIRERHSFYDLPVLFLTVRDQPAYLLVGFDAGANDYVLKPFKTSEFLARSRTLLRMKQSLRERLDIEMALIQAQIKPHFLYNTLNTIASLSEIDPDRTRDLLADFGTYLQNSFDLRNLDRMVPFEREWSLVQSYLNIEKARFGDRISVTFELPERVSFALPPLTLQPIVENALRHGILKRIEGGHIRIRVTETEDAVRIAVRDDGEGFSPVKKAAVLDGTYRSGIGLVNVHRRLLNAFGKGLSIESSEGEWTEVSYEIPLPASKEETT